jgi:hypothetical protein
MIAEVHQLRTKPAAINWMCSACGVDAGCNCGAPLMSKAQRVRESIEADPNKSNKQIARETGADPKQVRRERQRLEGDMSPPDAAEEEDEFRPPSIAERKASFLIFANEALLFAKYEGLVDHEILAAAKATASAWCRLVETMEKGK